MKCPTMNWTQQPGAAVIVTIMLFQNAQTWIVRAVGTPVEVHDRKSSVLLEAEAASYPANRQSLASPVAPYGTYRSGIKKNTSIR